MWQSGKDGKRTTVAEAIQNGIVEDGLNDRQHTWPAAMRQLILGEKGASSFE